MTTKHPAALAFLAALLAPASGARAETTLCQEITSAPAVITTQGVYCLKRNLSTAMDSGAAIEVLTNNVTIDCNGHKLGGLAAGDASFATGIGAVDRKNITVRNCSIRGFYSGVAFTGNAGGYHVVEDNGFDNNLHLAIRVEGSGSAIRRNQVRDTGGWASGGQARAIVLSGDAIEVVGNLVDGVHTTAGNAVGISVDGSTGLLVRDNLVRNVVSGGDDVTFGMSIGASTSAAVIGNTVWSSGAAVAYGISCSGASNAARDNAALDYAPDRGIVGCTQLDNHEN